MGTTLLAVLETGIAGAQAAPPGSPVALAWLLPVVPAVSAAVLLVLGRRLGAVAGWIGVAAAGVTAVIAIATFAYLAGQPEDARVFTHEVVTWIAAGDLDVTWALLVDPLASVMLLLVTGVGFVIHVYSLGYMHGDDRYHTFFGYLNLFLTSMLILVLGESLLTLFVGWELVGLCSYLLIGFWFERRDYASAAKKAFVVNRVGDVGFMIAMFVVFAAVGSLSFTEVLPAGETLATGTAVAIAVLLLIAATGKSAQIPLYVWLPDAMAGPTPVSALIHAATMVTAGVYLIARVSPLYALVPDVGMLVAWVGVATALLAALIACAQVDLKKILAYSTISQLGYMFVGVGVGAYTAGIFHLLTHGFFKALLFLAAGSVMHALADETDVRRMGGLARTLPVTTATSAIGVLAIAGFPLLSGFFSKEEILAAAADTPGGQGIWLVGMVVAALTAFYMGRWFVLIFLGEPRWDTSAVHPHESPLSMTAPLVVLAIGSVAGGLINLDPETGWLHGWLGPSVVGFEPRAEFLAHSTLLVLAVIAGLAGLAAAWVVYSRRALVPGTAEPFWPQARAWALGAFYVDELYQATIAHPGERLSRGFVWFDEHVVDGAVNGSARVTSGLAVLGRQLQTGFVRSYALAVLAGTVLVVLVLFGPTLLAGVFG